MNRRDEVFNAIEEHMANWMNDSTKVYAKLDRIYGVMPDDEEVVTGEWLKAIGCYQDRPWPSGTADWDVPSDDFRIMVRIWGDNKLGRDVIIENQGGSGNVQVEVKSRGQFRRLCEAWGVELQERKDGE